MNIQLIDYILIVVMAVMLIAVVVMLYYNYRWVMREKEAKATSKIQLARLALFLKTGRLRIWTYRPDTRIYTSISEDAEKTQEYIPIDFLQFFDRDDFETMRSMIFAICDGKQESGTLRIKSNPAADEGLRHYETSISVLERDDNGRPHILLGVQHDMTDALLREQEVSQLLMRYHTVFNSALSDMLYYDKDGRLSDINDKACSSFSINDRKKLLVSELRIEDNPLFGSIDFTHPVPMRTTAIMKIADL